MEDFVVPCQLVPGCVTPPIWFLSISPRVCSTRPSDPVSRRRPCASLSLRLHPAGKRTFTSKLCNMLGTHAKAERCAVKRVRSSIWLGGRSNWRRMAKLLMRDNQSLNSLGVACRYPSSSGPGRQLKPARQLQRNIKHHSPWLGG